MRLLRPAALTPFLSICLVGLLTGCSTNFVDESAPVQTPLGYIHGSVFGGRQPIVGAHLYVYAAGVGRPGTASQSLLFAYSGGRYPTTEDANGNYYVTTDAGGGFGLAGEYTCTSGQQLYIYAVGGQPTPNVTNLSSANMAILGNCPSSGSLAGQLSFVNLNEVSTAAAAFAFSGFATDATHVSASNNTLAQKGLYNAFQNVNNIYNVQAAGSSAIAVTPNGNGIPEQTKLNSLGNSIAACTNSAGATSSECNALFNAVLSNGTTGKTATDTATFAIYVAHNPRVHMSAVYSQAAKVGSPYFPILTTAPSDWTMRIAFKAPGIGRTAGHSPHDIAVDAYGNIYATSSQKNTWNQLSPLGVPASSTGYGTALKQPGSIAIDVTSSNVWLGNFGNQKISTFSTTGGNETEYRAPDSSVEDVELDGSGNIWVTANGHNSLGKMTPSGVLLSSTTGNLASPLSFAIQPGLAGDIWVADQSADEVSRFSNGNSDYHGSPYTAGGVNTPTGAAIDAGGNVWLANGDGTISEYDHTGSPLSNNPYPTGSGNYADAVAIDGDGNVWMTATQSVSSTRGSIYELDNSGNILSTTKGYAAAAGTEPDGLAIDGSGNVWYNSEGDDALYELVGAAAPVVTPLSYAVATYQLGSRP